jgi:hypothetical protein
MCRPRPLVGLCGGAASRAVWHGERAWRLGNGALGYPPDLIISALAHALLREDAGFHAFQMFDAGVRQFGEWGNTEPGRHILVAVARYLAAHSPTERGWLQTAAIAARLSRGDQLHADEPPARP